MTPPTTTDAELVARLRLVSMRLARRLRRESGDDITPSQLAVLGTVERHGPLTLGKIAEHEGVQPPTVTRIASWLEDQQLVTCTPSDDDRRAKVITISTAGSKRLQRIRSNRNAWLAQQLSHLSPADRDVLAEALPLLERLLGEEPRDEQGAGR